MDDQRGRSDAPGICNSRAFAINLRMVQRANHFTTQRAHIPIGNICLGMEAMEIADTCTHDRRLEERRLCYSPRRHESAIAPAHDTDSLAIHQPAIDQVLDT